MKHACTKNKKIKIKIKKNLPTVPPVIATASPSAIDA